MIKRLRIWLLVAAVLTATCGLILTACGNGEEEHEHTVSSWEIYTAATCTEEGTERGVCTGCGETVERSTGKLPHSYEQVAVTQEPNCTQTGLATVRCTVCGAESTEVLPISHDWQTINAETITFATCVTEGRRDVKCRICGVEDVEITPALGHDWDYGDVIEEATCTQKGLIHAVCTRRNCGVEQDIETPALGHTWETSYTVDAKPSFEKEGSRSIHCVRCDEKKNVTVIPRLQADTEIGYELRLVRTNGDLLTVANVSYTIYDENGTPLENGSGTFRNGVSGTLPLLPKNYTVKVSGYPEGYTAEESYTAVPDNTNGNGNTVCDIVLTASLISEPAAASTTYRQGSVMHDFSYTDVVTNETITLSELLKTKKMVVLNFWYVGCVYCAEEFPELEELYGEYGDDVAIIAVNASHYLNMAADSLTSIRDYKTRNGYSFYFVEDPEEGAYLSKKFGVSGTPINYFIDGEGVVAAMVDGYVPDANMQRLRSVFERYAGTPAVAAASYEAILPDERRS